MIDNKYVKNPNNYVIINAQSLLKMTPQLLEIFDAPYGTDLFRLYEKGVHIGFYDLKTERQVTIEEIMRTSF
ncbi:MAG: DUF2185 domain-containing protein [Lachnospiraceae bacterium]|nr:DUF2185 domain-containing protein [Lachnospiraceae bacterium]